MKNFIIYSFELVVFFTVFYVASNAPVSHPQTLKQEILDTVANLSTQELGPYKVPMIEGRACGKDFFCHAERSLETLKNITSRFNYLRRLLHQYNNKTGHTICRDFNTADCQCPIKVLLNKTIKCLPKHNNSVSS